MTTTSARCLCSASLPVFCSSTPSLARVPHRLRRSMPTRCLLSPSWRGWPPSFSLETRKSRRRRRPLRPQIHLRVRGSGTGSGGCSAYAVKVPRQPALRRPKPRSLQTHPQTAQRPARRAAGLADSGHASPRRRRDPEEKICRMHRCGWGWGRGPRRGGGVERATVEYVNERTETECPRRLIQWGGERADRRRVGATRRSSLATSSVPIVCDDVRARPVLLVQHAALRRWLCSARRAARSLCWRHADALTRLFCPCFPEHERGERPEYRTESRRASPEA